MERWRKESLETFETRRLRRTVVVKPLPFRSNMTHLEESGIKNFEPIIPLVLCVWNNLEFACEHLIFQATNSCVHNVPTSAIPRAQYKSYCFESDLQRLIEAQMKQSIMCTKRAYMRPFMCKKHWKCLLIPPGNTWIKMRFPHEKKRFLLRIKLIKRVG